jgi:hypothetical protein
MGRGRKGALGESANDRNLDGDGGLGEVEDVNSSLDVLLRKLLREDLGKLTGEDEGATL